MRSRVDGNGKPCASCSRACQPAPMPSVTRPLEIWSAVATTLASTEGWRKVAGETSVPRRSVVVSAPSAASVVHASSEPRSECSPPSAR